MTSVPASSDRPEAPLFSDGLGDRVVAVDGATGDLLQILRLRPQLLAVPSFEFALRERAARLANFRHAYYARVRRVDRHPGGLAVVSDHVEGTRLSDILRVAAERRLHLDLSAALCLIRQLVPSVALLHENARDVAHGLIAPERLIVTPHARLVIAEHVVGSAVEQLQYNRERLWNDLRVGLPSSAGAPRFDHRADVTALGLVALALILGRPLGTDDYPHRIGTLLHEARAKSALGEEQPLPSTLRTWLARALQLDARHGFASGIEAQVALEDVLADDTAIVAAPVALETFLSRYIAALLEPMPAPIVIAPPLPAAPAPAMHAPAPPPQTSGSVPPPSQSRPVTAPPAPAASEFLASAAHAPVTAASESRPEAEAKPPLPVATPAMPPVPPAPRSASPLAPDVTDVLRSIEPSIAGGTAKDRLEDFPPQASFAPAKPAKKSRGRGSRRLVIAALAIAVIGVGGYFGGRALRKAPLPVSGMLSVQTNPPGVAVFVDGVAHGNSPARLTLTPGSHILELRGRGVPRVVPITVSAGAEVSQYLELPETPTTGSLLIQSDPPGAQVSVDGEPHGVAPVSVADLAPGDHEVALQAEGGSVVRQHVVIQAGVTSSVLAPVATSSAGPVSGWLSIKAPVAMELREGGRLLGTSEADRIMMTAGRHDLEIVNETLGYRSTRTVQVPPGKVTALNIDLPQGAINVNASPWAEVWIDGRRVGETPIGNLPIAIGPHEVVFRHPQFGEKHQAISVTLSAPVRVSVDMK